MVWWIHYVMPYSLHGERKLLSISLRARQPGRPLGRTRAIGILYVAMICGQHDGRIINRLTASLGLPAARVPLSAACKHVNGLHQTLLTCCCDAMSAAACIHGNYEGVPQ